MPLNWYIETLKWKKGMSYKALSTRRSFKSILAGTTLALITPARVGEYGGRLLYVDEEDRGQALYSTLVGSIAQNTINVGIGSLGVLLMIYQYGYLKDLDAIDIGISLFIALVIAVLLYVYRRPLFRIARRYLPIGSTDVDISISDLFTILLYSFLRYGIYVFQYILVVAALGISSHIGISAMIIASIYFFQSMLPLPALLSVLARSEIAILLWGGVSDDTLGILTATFVLWIINLIIPSICGYLLMVRHRSQ